MNTAFTYRSSRSGSILAALLIAIVVETCAIYLWLHARFPAISWTLLVISLLSAVWIVWDYVARGAGHVELEGEHVVAKIGLRPPLKVPADLIDRAIVPTWREMPKPADAYVNLTAPAQPNVLLSLRSALNVPLVLGLHRRTLHLGMHLDEPERFIGMFNEWRTRVGVATR